MIDYENCEIYDTQEMDVFCKFCNHSRYNGGLCPVW